MPSWLKFMVAAAIIVATFYLAVGLTLHAIDSRYGKTSWRWIWQQVVRGLLTLLISLISIGAAVSYSMHWPRQLIGVSLLVLTAVLATVEWYIFSGGFHNCRRLIGSLVMNVAFSISLAGGLASIAEYLKDDPATRGRFDYGAVITLVIVFACRQFWQMFAYSTVAEYKGTRYYVVNPSGRLIGLVNGTSCETAAQAGKSAIEEHGASLDGRWKIAQVTPIVKSPPKGWIRGARDFVTRSREKMHRVE